MLPQDSAGNATAVAASAALRHAAPGAVAENRFTSRLGSLEFNTPYAHEIAGLAAVLLVVATVSIALGVKFTRWRGPRVGPGAADCDLQCGDRGCGSGKSRWECAPIMHRLQRKYSSYESLQQTDGHHHHLRDCGRGVFRFNARLDSANGLLCLYGMQVHIFADGGECSQPLDGWRIAIDIVTQTDVECRQTRLQTRLSTEATASLKKADDDGSPEGIHAVPGWKSETLEDVLTVRVNQTQDAPLRGRLLIRVLGHNPTEKQNSHPHHQHQWPTVKLGGATFPLDRIREPTVCASSLSVTLRDETA